MIRVLQALSEAGGPENEDLIWTEPGLLALLDGSTSLIPTPLNARWFTACFTRGLAEHPDGSLIERVNGAIAYTEERYRQSGLDADADYYPSAAGIFVQERGESLEILAVGDCTGLFFLKDGSVLTVTDDRVKRLDESVLELCRTLGRLEGKSIAEMVGSEEIRSRLLQNRRKMNRPDGYKILAVGMEDCTEDELVCLDTADVCRIILFSDGFDAVQDGFLAPELSLKTLYEQLRRREDEDADFMQMPRFKPGDDASALVAEPLSREETATA